MTTSIQEALIWSNEFLNNNQSKESSYLSAGEILKKSRTLLCEILSKDPSFSFAYPNHLLSLSEFKAFQKAIYLLARGYPLSRILNKREFWGLPFSLNADTLDPRPESETLVETVLSWLDNQKTRQTPLRLLDLGTGSGCLILSLLTELSNATGIAVDLSFNALLQTQKNAEFLGLSKRISLINTSWTNSLKGPFDIVISNPPYIAREELALCDPIVKRFDPPLALEGGKDGLVCYKKILEEIPSLLAPQHRCFFEIGSSQEKDLFLLCKAFGYKDIQINLDLEKRPRVISFCF